MTRPSTRVPAALQDKFNAITRAADFRAHCVVGASTWPRRSKEVPEALDIHPMASDRTLPSRQEACA